MDKILKQLGVKPWALSSAPKLVDTISFERLDGFWLNLLRSWKALRNCIKMRASWQCHLGISKKISKLFFTAFCFKLFIMRCVKDHLIYIGLFILVTLYQRPNETLVCLYLTLVFHIGTTHTVSSEFNALSKFRNKITRYLFVTGNTRNTLHNKYHYLIFGSNNWKIYLYTRILLYAQKLSTDLFLHFLYNTAKNGDYAVYITPKRKFYVLKLSL